MPLTITELLEKKLNQKGTNALNIVVSTIGAPVYYRSEAEY